MILKMLSKPMWKCKCGKVYKAVFTVLGLHTKLNESHYPQKKKTLKSGELSQKQLAYKNYCTDDSPRRSQKNTTKKKVYNGGRI